MTDIKLTQGLVQVAVEAGILDLITWDDYITSKKYVERQISVGVQVPNEIVEFVNQPPNSSLRIDVPEIKYDPITTNFYYREPISGLNITQHCVESGFGINNGSVKPGSFMKRYNGMELTPARSIVKPYPILITELSCGAEGTNADAYYDCLHYDINGENGVFAGRLLYSMQGGKMGSAWLNVKVLIPAYRRMTLRVGGSDISYPQGHFKYHQVLDHID